MSETRIKKAKIIVFIIYFLTVLRFTVFNRSVQFSAAPPELFWSYKAWFAGDANLGREILANIAMFIPFGFLLSAILQLRKKSIVVVPAAILFAL